MLEAIGVESIDALWQQAQVLEPSPDLQSIPNGQSEYEVTRRLSSLAGRNRPDLVCFAGGGFYEHFIPAAISHIVERGEFLTAYTPYQAEASQGTLQAIYEYQSAICRLTQMEVSNASLYDGGTALFEAILMALRKGRGEKILLAGSLNPIYRQMIACASAHLDGEIVVTADGPPVKGCRGASGASGPGHGGRSDSVSRFFWGPFRLARRYGRGQGSGGDHHLFVLPHGLVSGEAPRRHGF
jgi:glycine dehydrogenase subunit 1